MYEQKLCSHDFGVISFEYVDEDNKLFQDGFCLECGAEFTNHEGQLFIHSFKMNKVRSSFSYKDYKRELDELKRVSAYDQEPDYIIGEKIMEELIKRATEEKKK